MKKPAEHLDLLSRTRKVERKTYFDIIRHLFSCLNQNLKKQRSISENFHESTFYFFFKCFPHRNQQQHAGPVDWVTLCNELILEHQAETTHELKYLENEQWNHFNKMNITQIVAWFIESEVPDVFGLIVQQETAWEEDQEERSINVSQCVGWVNM